jgi:hypothetical protein
MSESSQINRRAFLGKSAAVIAGGVSSALTTAFHWGTSALGAVGKILT